MAASRYGYRITRRMVRSAAGGKVARYAVRVWSPTRRVLLHDSLASREQAARWGRAWVSVERKREARRGR